jgi:lipid-binding SYLF domain-containing protein
MSTPGKRIPEVLLRDAQAVVVVPRTIKLGLIAGVQRGRGVVLTRQADGSWSLPQFVTITGGSIGWQAGAQASDFVLLFRTPESVQDLLDGKFTIGADASAAAGPVGRRVNASTDIQLESEILSYARSKGLFAGVSLDGSILQLDPTAAAGYYRDGHAPQSAVQLVSLLEQYSGGKPGRGEVAIEAQEADVARSAPRRNALSRCESARRQLADAASRMYAALNENWRSYLALPAEVFDPSQLSQPEALAESLRHYDAIAADARYRALATRREFQETHRLLKAYADAQADSADKEPRLALPPPPSPPGRVKRASAESQAPNLKGQAPNR